MVMQRANFAIELPFSEGGTIAIATTFQMLTNTLLGLPAQDNLGQGSVRASTS